MTRAFNSDGQLTLVMRTGAGYSAGQNLGSLRNKAAKLCNILVIDGFHSVDAEAADLLAGLASAGAAVLSVVSVVSISHGNKPPFLISIAEGNA